MEQLEKPAARENRPTIIGRLAASAFHAAGAGCNLYNAVKIQDDPGLLAASLPNNNRAVDYLVAHQPAVAVCFAAAGAFSLGMSLSRLNVAVDLTKERIKRFRSNPDPLFAGLSAMDRPSGPTPAPRNNRRGGMVRELPIVEEEPSTKTFIDEDGLELQPETTSSNGSN